jgi:steroid delta-isomerase-like uncharacterized protein
LIILNIYGNKPGILPGLSYEFLIHGDIMSPEKNQDIIRCFISELVNKGNINFTDRFISPWFVGHDQGLLTDAVGPEGFILALQALNHAFPDISFQIDDLIAENDRVVCRWTARGRHREEFLNLPASGDFLTVNGMVIFRFSEAQIVECWVQWDSSVLLRQVGIFPGQLGAVMEKMAWGD